MNTIKNIIFDLGNVLEDLNELKLYSAFNTLLGQRDPLPALFSLFKGQAPIVDELDTGKISNETFRNFFRKSFRASFTDAVFDEAWCSLLQGINAEKIILLQRLRPHYRLFLLSNTNAIHLPYIKQATFKKHGIRLDELFEKTYYSHEIGFRKPNPAAFQLLLNEQHLLTQETLFIDDHPLNIAAAQRLGLLTLHLVYPYALLEYFELADDKMIVQLSKS